MHGGVLCQRCICNIRAEPSIGKHSQEDAPHDRGGGLPAVDHFLWLLQHHQQDQPRRMRWQERHKRGGMRLRTVMPLDQLPCRTGFAGDRELRQCRCPPGALLYDAAQQG